MSMVPGWISNVEPVSTRENQAPRVKASEANGGAGTEQSDMSKESERNTKASSPSKEMTLLLSVEDKLKGWKASPTAANIKVHKGDARENDEAVHPHHGERKPEPQITHDQHEGKDESHQNQHKKRKAKTPQSQSTPSTEPGTQILYPSNNDGTVEAQAPIPRKGHFAKPTDAAQPHTYRPAIQFIHQQPLPPCGIAGCPVKAPHERRAYGFEERKRPSFVKLLQGKMRKSTASKREVEKVERFFGVHGDI